MNNLLIFLKDARHLFQQVLATGRTCVHGKFGQILFFEIIHRTLALIFFVPLSVGVLEKLIDTWGKPSIGNFEIAGFLLSWPGIFFMIATGSLFLTRLYLESAGLILIMQSHDHSRDLYSVFRSLLIKAPRLFALGLIQILAYLALLLPGSMLTLAIIHRLWKNYDINALVILRPPAYWFGVIAGVIFVGISAIFVLKLFFRWFLALPAILLDSPEPRPLQALILSKNRTFSHKRQIAIAFTCWLLFQLLLSFTTLVLLKKSADLFLDFVGTSLALALPATIFVLSIHSIIISLLSVFTGIGFAVLIIHLDSKYTPRPLNNNSPDLSGLSPKQKFRFYAQSLKHPIIASLVVLGLVTTTGCYVLINQIDAEDDMLVIAHRAGGALAPENTVAAVKNAIKIGAPWAEIDVQFTSDKAIIVAHDTDLRRLGGLNKLIKDCTLVEVQSVDVGSKFSEKFKGEKIPTLDEFLDAAKNQIHVLIELKPHNSKDGTELARAVVNLLQRRHEISQHKICSQSYEAILEAKRTDPAVSIGFIAAQAIGPLENLKVDFLMLSLELATRRLVEKAKAVHKPVYAWTIDNPDLVLPLLDRGESAVITNNPPLISARLKEIEDLNPVQRLILKVRNILAD